MRTSPRFAYSVPKIGKGSFSPSGPSRVFSQAGSLQHHIRRPAFALPRSNTLSPLASRLPHYRPRSSSILTRLRASTSAASAEAYPDSAPEPLGVRACILSHE